MSSTGSTGSAGVKLSKISKGEEGDGKESRHYYRQQLQLLAAPKKGMFPYKVTADRGRSGSNTQTTVNTVSFGHFALPPLEGTVDAAYSRYVNMGVD